jgi:hypothetical protein
MTSKSKIISACAIAFAAAVAPATAYGQSTIRDPNPPKYPIEVEPKLNFNPSGVYAYGGSGFGPGVRLSIPVMSPGFVKTINDSIAISFGLDLIHYDSYYYAYYGPCGPRGGYCNYNYGDFWTAYFPVTMQWNFWLTDKWSVFGEPGFALRHSFYSDAYCAGYFCPSRDDIYFAFFAGGRYAVSDHLALTMRLGYPTVFSFGLSIFP